MAGAPICCLAAPCAVCVHFEEGEEAVRGHNRPPCLPQNGMDVHRTGDLDQVRPCDLQALGSVLHTWQTVWSEEAAHAVQSWHSASRFTIRTVLVLPCKGRPNLTIRPAALVQPPGCRARVAEEHNLQQIPTGHSRVPRPA